MALSFYSLSSSSFVTRLLATFAEELLSANP